MDFDWINAIAGFGVGALMTPIMVLLFGVAPHTAVGTDLWFAGITQIVGGWVHGKRGSVDWQASIGAGALDAVMLLYLYPRRMKPNTLVGLRMLLS